MSDVDARSSSSETDPAVDGEGVDGYGVNFRIPKTEVSSEPHEISASATVPGILSYSVRRRMFVYLSILILLLAFGAPSGGVIGIPISFILKNRLHLAPREIAEFRLISAIPLYMSFVFGMIRDTWNPFGMGDRGFMLVFGVISAGLYVFFAFTPMTYGTLLIGVLLLTSSFLFVLSAQKGLTSTIAQQNTMSGQISAVWNIVTSIVAAGALLIGGTLSGLLEKGSADQATRTLFLVGALIMTSVVGYAAWRPGSVFDNISIEQRGRSRPLNALGKLVRHWPIYPALLVSLLWDFAPGIATPLQYHLQNTLHATDAQWGQWQAILAVSFIPTYTLFGFLCQKFPLKILLWWGAVIGVPQLVPLLFIHSVTGALIAAVPIGLMGGIASAAYLDLIIRSCPRGLQGTMLMTLGSLIVIDSRFGDLLGTTIYES